MSVLGAEEALLPVDPFGDGVIHVVDQTPTVAQGRQQRANVGRRLNGTRNHDGRVEAEEPGAFVELSYGLLRRPEPGPLHPSPVEPQRVGGLQLMDEFDGLLRNAAESAPLFDIRGGRRGDAVLEFRDLGPMPAGRRCQRAGGEAGPDADLAETVSEGLTRVSGTRRG
jgi:hypothetical protein